MNFTLIIGFVVGSVLIAATAYIDGSNTIKSFINIGAIMTGLGGPICSCMINFSGKDILNTFNLVRYCLKGQVLPNPQDVIAILVNLAVKARKEGLLALEDEASTLNDDFMKKGLLLVVDGDDPEVVKNMLGNDIVFTQERHRVGAKMFRMASFYAPSFGMVGTLIGMVIMLASLNTPERLGPAFALALVNTLYGAVLAFFIFLPISGRLEERSKEEIKMKRLIMEGILSIQAGDNPRTVEDKLNVFLSPKERKNLYNAATK
jgi:chemotaxis protein MotA